jgi:hypothetical protein
LNEALGPLPAERIRVVLASFAGMAARIEFNPVVARALTDQAVHDLRCVPGFALLEAADAFRQGKVGDGRWRPPPGELAKEARKRAEPFFAELQRIDRVLGSPLLRREPEKRPGTASAIERDVANAARHRRGPRKPSAILKSP